MQGAVRTSQSGIAAVLEKEVQQVVNGALERAREQLTTMENGHAQDGSKWVPSECIFIFLVVLEVQPWNYFPNLQGSFGCR